MVAQKIISSKIKNANHVKITVRHVKMKQHVKNVNNFINYIKMNVSKIALKQHLSKMINVNHVLKIVKLVQMNLIVVNVQIIITFSIKLVLNHVLNNITKIMKNKNVLNVQKILKFVQKLLFNNAKRDLFYSIMNVLINVQKNIS